MNKRKKQERNKRALFLMILQKIWEIILRILKVSDKSFVDRNMLPHIFLKGKQIKQTTMSLGLKKNLVEINADITEFAIRKGPCYCN